MFLTVKATLNADTYYFECCAGLGDTMLTVGFLHALVRKYKAPIHFIVKPTHAFIPKMYGIDEFWTIGCELSLKEMERSMSLVPVKGKIYSAHPCKHPELREFFNPIYYYTATFRFVTWFKALLQIDDCETFELPLSYPDLSKETERKCLKLAPLDKIVLFSPEATSVPAIPWYYWEEKAEELTRRGFTVISNVIDPHNSISNTKYIKLNSEDMVALAMRCHSVYSLRSGLCDLIFSRGADLHVLYPLHNTFFIYELNEMFRGYSIDEQIILFE